MGTARLACTVRLPALAGGALPFSTRICTDCQPPCQLPLRDASPCRLAPEKLPARPGKLSTQRWALPASASVTSSVPAPCVGAMVPSRRAWAPGTVADSWPLTAATDVAVVAVAGVVVTCPWACTWAWSAKMRRFLSVRMSRPHWPCATTLSSRRVRGGALALVAELMATSNASMSPACEALAVPLRAAGASWVWSVAGDRLRTVALACQGAGAGLQLPCKATSPGPVRRVARGTVHVVPSNRACAASWSSGRRLVSQGPGRLLRMLASICHTPLAPVAPVAPVGGVAGAPAVTVPSSRVTGACGQSWARFKALNAAWACTRGWGAHGAISACNCACMACWPFASSVAGSGCSWAFTCRRASAPARVPSTVAWATTAKGALLLPGTGVVIRPSRVAFSAMGAAPCNCTVAL